MVLRVILGFGLSLGVSAALGWAQEPPPAQQPPAQQPAPIVSNVSEVIVPVTVTDEKGRFVSNLDQSDFQIFDQGRVQKITSFTRERNQPVVVGFLLDMSNNSRTQWKHWQESAEDMVNEMLPDVKPGVKKRFSGYLIGYSDQAELMVDTTSEAALRCDLRRVRGPQAGARRTDGAAARDYHHRRRWRQSQPAQSR
jgi:VWFA-related protein